MWTTNLGSHLLVHMVQFLLAPIMCAQSFPKSYGHTQFTLLAHPPNGEIICHCSTCGKKCERFFYSCYECSFNIDIVCLSAMDMIHHTIKHESHDHQLIHVQRPALFFCLACGTEHRGASYLCTTCGFWVNQICASLPRTVKYRKHHHQLALSYSLPDEYYQFRPDCDICSGKLRRMHWVYLCVGCRYFAHVNCATSKAEPSRLTHSSCLAMSSYLFDCFFFRLCLDGELLYWT